MSLSLTKAHSDLKRRRVGGLQLEFRNLSEDNIEDAILACSPEEMMSDSSFRKGIDIRKEWLLYCYRAIGSCCKMAYVRNVPIGMIQFNPMHRIPYFTTNRRDALYVHCIFVKKAFRERGIGSKLLQSLIDNMKKPNPHYEDQECRVLVTTARQRQAFRQPSYFRIKGFSQVGGNIDAGLVYWLSGRMPRQTVVEERAVPVRVQEKHVKIFYDPCCQWCVFINDSVKKRINEIKPSTPVEEFNIWKDSKEALRRCVTSRTTYVNGMPIQFTDAHQFKEDIKVAFCDKVKELS